MNFVVLKDTIEDLLAQHNLDKDKMKEKPNSLDDAKWATLKKAANTI